VKTHDRRAVHSSRSPEWGTPPVLFSALNREFAFCLDVAASRSNRKCNCWLGPEQKSAGLRDGLRADWLAICLQEVDALPTAFMNPPYARDLGMLLEPWIKKAHAEAARGLIVVGLIPHRPDTRWWHAYVMQAAEIRQIPHRVKFWKGGKESDSAAFPSAVVIWRPNPGYLGPVSPRLVSWSYRDRKTA
jgi:phage N-6-adenine-methyltransferase